MTEIIANTSLLQIVGIIGVSLYLCAYSALQLGFLRGQGYLYPAINMTAAACVLASLMESFNLSSAVIQISWIVISLVGITRMAVIHARLRFSDEEREFMRAMLKFLPRPRARALLNQGLWLDVEKGTILTAEGVPVDGLYYLASGKAAVLVSDRLVAEWGQGAMIGELTYLSGAPASATVKASQPLRCLRFDAAKLRAFLEKNQDIQAALEQNMANHLRAKLVSSSAAEPITELPASGATAP